MGVFPICELVSLGASNGFTGRQGGGEDVEKRERSRLGSSGDLAAAEAFTCAATRARRGSGHLSCVATRARRGSGRLAACDGVGSNGGDERANGGDGLDPLMLGDSRGACAETYSCSSASAVIDDHGA